MTQRPVHKAYDGLEVRSKHILKSGKATANWAFDDWYYISVDGVFPNGNIAKGTYCREQAETVREWLKS